MKIPVAEPTIDKDDIALITAAAKSGWVSSIGQYIREFEDGFAGYCGTKYGVVTSNGTTALHLALLALGIGEGDEVIMPTLTFVATANAVKYTGASVTFVDSQPDYWCLDPEKVAAAVTPKTKAILPVHLYGHPCDMDPLTDIAKRHNLSIIEDAAEAHGAEYRGKKVGSLGDIACFSFYGNKVITTGEGGMCLTDDKHLLERMKVLRDHAMNPEKRYWHDEIGYNYRMTNLQAALGVSQLKKIDTFIEKKREIARWYASGLNELREKGLVTFPTEMAWARNIYWMYSILIDDTFGLERDELMARLDEKGIDTRPLFHPVHLMPMYWSGQTFPVAEALSHTGISLPSSVNLTSDQVNYIAEIIKGQVR